MAKGLSGQILLWQVHAQLKEHTQVIGSHDKTKNQDGGIIANLNQLVSE